MNGNIYKRYASGRAKKSSIMSDTTRAFLIGGTVCCFGEGLRRGYLYFGLSQDNAGMLTSVTIVMITAILTGLGVFDNIAKLGGGGTLVPITGFANGVTSAAIDNKSEGLIMGVGAKIFTIAGPVILYGISAGVIYGIIYWLMSFV